MKKLLSILLSFILLGNMAYVNAEGINTAQKEPILVEAKEPYFIDVDLTKLSSTMVFGEVYNMLVNTQDYIGKTIKMGGMYSSNFFDLTQKNYHYVVISDAMACCQQGLEFVIEEERKYPEEYPQIGNYIEVVGVFGVYEELGTNYPYIKVLELKEKILIQ
ncbi:MAG: hypothetical protein GYA87_01560 [Christensenellaceae bacterium]|nr:hypothetical protein [Christensenellaceae bacterium]